MSFMLSYPIKKNIQEIALVLMCFKSLIKGVLQNSTCLFMIQQIQCKVSEDLYISKYIFKNFTT